MIPHVRSRTFAPAFLLFLLPSAGVATANVGEGYHSHEGDIIQIVKRGSGIIARDDLGEGPQYWGTYSAAQVWDGRMWFAVVIPEKVDGSFKHGAWVSAVDISRVEEEQY